MSAASLQTESTATGVFSFSFYLNHQRNHRYENYSFIHIMALLRAFLFMMVAYSHMNILLLGVHALHMTPPLPSVRIPRCNNYPLPNPRIRITPTSKSLSSSNLFGINQKRNCRNDVLRRCWELHSTNGGGDNNNSSSNAVDAEMVTSSTSTSFLRAVDSFGMKLKPWALSAYQRSLSYSNNAKSINGEEGTATATTGGGDDKQRMKRTSNFKSILCRIQSNILWILYILYRGYRGFFVILPAVFSEVYAQLNDSDLIVDVYGDEEMEEKEYAVNANASSSSSSSLQKEQMQQPMKLRTRITISILSFILTLSYVVSGALRVLGEYVPRVTVILQSLIHNTHIIHNHYLLIIVLGKFIKTFTNTASFESSFEAAAEEVIDNENKLRSNLK